VKAIDGGPGCGKQYAGLMLFLGVDPGVSGGLAILESDGSIFHVVAMPRTERDVLEHLQVFRVEKGRGVLERVWSSPGWGHVGAFGFGRSYGGLRMAMTAIEIPFDEVLPKAWQAVVGVHYPPGKPRDKNISKRRAQQLFPGTTITHATADALLIAEYCRRIHGVKRGKEEGRRQTTKKAGK
jgi:hypothetical protein